MNKKDVLDYVSSTKKELELKDIMKSINTIILDNCDISYTHELLNRGIYPLIVSGDSQKVLRLVSDNNIYRLGEIAGEDGVAFLTPGLNDKFNFVCDNSYENIETIEGIMISNNTISYKLESGSYINLDDYIGFVMNKDKKEKQLVR